MIIVLEGEDGSGKTTLARTIAVHCQRLKGRIFQAAFGPPAYDTESDVPYPDQVYAQHKALLEAAEEPPEDIFIVDRFHWGTYVYGRLFRSHRDLDGWGDMGKDRFLAIEDTITRLGGVTCYVTNNLDILARRVALRGDEFLGLDPSGQETNLFEDARKKLFPVSLMYQELLLKSDLLSSRAPFTATLNEQRDTQEVARCLAHLAMSRR